MEVKYLYIHFSDVISGKQVFKEKEMSELLRIDFEKDNYIIQSIFKKCFSSCKSGPLNEETKKLIFFDFVRFLSSIARDSPKIRYFFFFAVFGESKESMESFISAKDKIFSSMNKKYFDEEIFILKNLEEVVKTSNKIDFDGLNGKYDKKIYQCINDAFGVFPLLSAKTLDRVPSICPSFEKEMMIKVSSHYFGWSSFDKCIATCEGGHLIIKSSMNSKYPSDIAMLYGGSVFIGFKKNSETVKETQQEIHIDIRFDTNHRPIRLKLLTVDLKKSSSILDDDFLSSLLYPIIEELGNKNDSFAPVRYNINAQWYVNGQPFYERLWVLFNSAKKEIFFSAWWISPQLYLRRQKIKKNSVPLSREEEVINASSNFDEKSLQEVKDYFSEDQKIISDMNEKETELINDRFDEILLRKAQSGVMIYILLWNQNPFMPRLASSYVANYFSQKHQNFKVLIHPFKLVSYGHHQKMIVVDQRIGLEGGLDVCFGRYDDEKHRLEDSNHLKTTWIGIDYWNPTVRGTHSVEYPYYEYIDRTRNPRMGWHDVAVEVDAGGARDLSKNFIERWNNSRKQLIHSHSNLADKLVVERNIPIITLNQVNFYSFNNNIYYSDLKIEKENYILKKEINVREDIDSTGMGIQFKNLYEEESNPIQKMNFSTHNNSCIIQITRNLSEWSGCSRISNPTRGEASLYSSWLNIVNKAEHYIFIEQQYFISDTAGFGIKNKLGSILVEKVKKALKNGTKFKIFVCFPLQPDANYYEDMIGRAILFYEIRTSHVGESSIFSQISKECKKYNKDPNDYYCLFCLRNWGKISKKLVTEQVYPHTKIMIVDDIYAIIGSANLYDRSYYCERDSEISCTIKDNARVKTKMEGKEFNASRFAYSLRLFLFNEFCGLKSTDLTFMDPISDDSFKLFCQTIKNNEKIIEEIFPNAPGNNLVDWSDCKGKDMECQINQDYTEEEAEIKLRKEFKGIACEFPKKFMSTNSLWAKFSQVDLLRDELIQ